MEFIIAESTEDMSRRAADRIASFVEADPSCVLGLATGTTPIGLYACLVDDCAQDKISFADVTTFNLDEYVGIPRDHEQSYWTFMHENLFSGIDVKEENVHVPYGDTKADCEAYEKAMEDVSVDIQVLGIGANGHIGFNEPGTPFDEETHIVTLTEKTRQDNARFFEGDINKVPTHAITMGIATIMKAKKILMVATGENKADAIKAMVEGEISTDCPASVLQNHKDVVVIVDEAAASKLSK